MSVNDEDQSSYLTVVASLYGDSDDEDLNQAIIASLESHMWVANQQNFSLRGAVMAFQNCQMNNEKSQFKRYMSGTVKQN